MKSVNNKKVAIVLGGTVPHKHLIENLKKRGYNTILIDYNENPPAASAADLHIQESALDKNEIEKIAINHQASLIISAALDQPLPIAIAVAEKLNLPVPFSLNTALDLTNKGRMKSVLTAHSIETPESKIVSIDHQDVFFNIEYPLVIKPEDGTGSRGITIIRQAGEINKALELACEFSSTNRAVVEQYIFGVELAVDVIISNKKSKVLLCRERHKQSITKEEYPLQCVATISPANISEKELKVLTACTEKISRAFDIKNGVLHVQGILDESGSFKVIEVAGRVSGGPGGFYAVKNKTGVDLIDYFLDCYLNKAEEQHPEDNKKFYATGSLYCKEGTLGSFLNTSKLIDSGFIDSFSPYKNPGEFIPSGFTTKNRIAGYAVSASSREELKEKLNILFETVEVVDTKGRPLLLKEIGVHKCL
ncbi:MAG: acetyl-CoA carboxylase biotin carboxylase subunit family protein [Nitrincola lacisaponensis]|uniref:ATP-grasp domain-containing protein n=1 Tax=Nitrincola lacisaponensis TaxID=267850 RepID=UPI00391CBBA3